MNYIIALKVPIKYAYGVHFGQYQFSGLDVVTGYYAQIDIEKFIFRIWKYYHFLKTIFLS